RSTRRWTLFSWFFLTLGNIFGGAWAYEVLGWGGYWAWDPVENAAFMPWLVMTAFLHSVMIQEKKDMLKVWNVSLIVLAFSLTIFGTFLTRSGVISSVHSFTQSGLGPFFMWFLGFELAVAIALVVWRLPLLRSENQLESFLSREAAFLFNNLILLGICFTIFWGTIFPVISEWVRGVKITVGPPFFNKVNAPLGLSLLFLTGIGPIIAWRRATPRNLLRSFAGPLRFDRHAEEDNPHISITGDDVTVLDGGRSIGVLRPEKRFYKRPGQPTTEVAIRKTLREDLYLVLGALDPSSGLVTFQTFLNPLVSWLWIGGAVMVIGTAVVMTPTPAERHARATVEARATSAALSRAE